MPEGVTFTLIDWLVVGSYLLIVIALGAWCGRGQRTGKDLFLAGRSMPMWAVSISVVATSLSAATFIGGPQSAYLGDLTYLSANIGGLLGALVVAWLFIPAFYSAGVTSVYELLGASFGSSARTASSGMFLIGRVMASGARLFMVALPFSLIAFGDTSPRNLVGSILVIATAACAYTCIGGIRAVIWTDVLQAVIVLITVIIAIWVLWMRIGLSTDEMLAVLNADGGDKTQLISLSTDLTTPYTLWTALIGFMLFNIAAYGTDQDLTQRMLTCRDAKSGAWSMITASLIGLPVVCLFLIIGLLLFVYHQQPGVTVGDDTRAVFLEFLLTEMPTGVRGLMIAGLFAAAMSSTDSALNAMAASTVSDFVKPLLPGVNDGKAARLAIACWAVVLAGFACFCVWWQQASEMPLIDFALGVMVFAYAGLLGVFLTALLTKRGNGVSAIAALLAGFVVVLVLQAGWFKDATGIVLAFPWRMTVASAIAFGVCCLGSRQAKPTQSSLDNRSNAA